MHYKHLAGILIFVIFTVSCAPDEVPDSKSQAVAMPTEESVSLDGHNSRNSLDWAGTYSGVLPCADCPGIDTVVTLHSDGTYERSVLYIDEAFIPQTANGMFTWNDTGNNIELNAEGDETVKYQVGENQLFHLDGDGQRITSSLAAHYVLHKHQHDMAIEGKRWTLIELRDHPIETERDAVLILQAEGSVASGNSSCNSFSGSYAIKSGQRISFGRNMAATKMACPDMSTELAFLEVLRVVDNYSLSDDGKLSLNRARMAPLARFEVAGKN